MKSPVQLTEIRDFQDFFFLIFNCRDVASEITTSSRDSKTISNNIIYEINVSYKILSFKNIEKYKFY